MCEVAACVFLLPPLEIPRLSLFSKQHWPQKNLWVTNRNTQSCVQQLYMRVCVCVPQIHIPMSKAVLQDSTDGEKGQILHLGVKKKNPATTFKVKLNQRTWFLFHSVCSPGSSHTSGLRGPRGQQKRRHRESGFLTKPCDTHNKPTSQHNRCTLFYCCQRF